MDIKKVLTSPPHERLLAFVWNFFCFILLTAKINARFLDTSEQKVAEQVSYQSLTCLIKKNYSTHEIICNLFRVRRSKLNFLRETVKEAQILIHITTRANITLYAIIYM